MPKKRSSSSSPDADEKKVKKRASAAPPKPWTEAERGSDGGDGTAHTDTASQRWRPSSSSWPTRTSRPAPASIAPWARSLAARPSPSRCVLHCRVLGCLD
ncbi:hypothetical protein FA09DRAFT_89339 [Tilletiopsis washingtonensis]|uniref:Uncharacterized protein n=1 Tax=Tilletiopsis washingtonensis TaxID=58919 RepID=A0A316Z527_9BASI|nr:hypothetical protein FA09DRAFT_89339 [Tilletiopsis washingtonensis]PWN96456.1 hypothetical protein FA09DRAFT_89339 [Tilletiopsis washingtonensis]